MDIVTNMVDDIFGNTVQAIQEVAKDTFEALARRQNFIITKDLLEGDSDEPRGWPFVLGAKSPGKGWTAIQLFDDDGELYYLGYASEDGPDVPTSDGFENAWNWGAWYAGTTGLKGRKADGGYEWIIG